MNLPPLAWVILALGLIWLVLRTVNRRAEERRQEARDQRMAELLAERERLAGPPASLAAVVSDANGDRDAAPKERTCLGCKAVNPAGASACQNCGLEL